MLAASLDPNLARRAIGAMFFFAFGGAWLEYYAFQVVEGYPLVFAVIALVTIVLVAFAYLRCKHHQPALAADPPSPERQRAERVFILVNIGQAVAIFVGINVLINLGLSNWAVPLVILVVGLHFLPLAYSFANPPHYVTGVALIIVSVVYPLVASNGPNSSVGSLAAGLILWASALWAIAANKSFKRTRLRRAA
jgi:hypothetical protein